MNKRQSKRRIKVDPIDEPDPLFAFDELRSRVADLEALAHAAEQIVLPWIADREKRREMGRLGYYVTAMAWLSRSTVYDAERTAAKLMKLRTRPPMASGRRR
ncbi:MAG: hypothetical protein NT062_06900 [Proteobacteria bacterium]|nr:hypothetical protein [Pseudomonadota bacterium]